MEKQHLGQAVVKGTTYQVFALPVGENSARAGIKANLALEGPNGACYFVTDYGPAYKLNSVACGGSQKAWKNWTPTPRPLRGLTRDNLSLFLGEAR